LKHRRRDWGTKSGESRIDHLVGRLSYPHPAKISFIIEVPGCAATVHDLRSPLVVGRRNCERKCDDSRENHPAKNSHEERALHFHLLSVTLQPKLAFAPVLPSAKESIFNVIHNEGVIKVDCIVRKNTPYRRAEFERRKQIQIDNFSTWIANKEDLINGLW
jgi:hypothetical protein